MDVGSSLAQAVTSQRTLDEMDSARADIESRLLLYLSHFDGRRKEFAGSSLRTHFEDLFSDDMVHLHDGRPMDKDQFRRLIRRFAEAGVVATLEDIDFYGGDELEFTVHWATDDTSAVMHVSASVEDGRIVRVVPSQETRGAFAAFGYSGEELVGGREGGMLGSYRIKQLRELRDRWTRRRSKLA
mmetsp:Transcript_12320/g.28069  ORF Transcript_12320/g.28069 Transcript_12320/m.28069 type:complete len:185 (-) Transcript_12320:136-690(-)